MSAQVDEKDGSACALLVGSALTLAHLCCLADVPFDKTINSVPEPNPSREWEVLDVQNEPNPNY